MPSSGKTVVKLLTQHRAMHPNTGIYVHRGTTSCPWRRQVEAPFPARWGRCSCCLGLVDLLFHGIGFGMSFLRAFSLSCCSNQIDRALAATGTHFRKKSTGVLIITSASSTFSPSQGGYFVVTGHRLLPLPWEACTYRLYLAAPPRSFAAGHLLLLTSF